MMGSKWKPSMGLATVLLTLGSWTMPQERNDGAANSAQLEAARRLQTAGEYSAAAEAFETALEANPEDYGAQYNYALSLAQGGSTERALAAFERALELQDESQPDPRLFNSLGWTHFLNGDYEEAVTWLERAIDRTSGDQRATSLNNLGVVYMRLGKLGEAQEAFSEAVDLGSGRAQENQRLLAKARAVLRTKKKEPR